MKVELPGLIDFDGQSEMAQAFFLALGGSLRSRLLGRDERGARSWSVSLSTPLGRARLAFHQGSAYGDRSPELGAVLSSLFLDAGCALDATDMEEHARNFGLDLSDSDQRSQARAQWRGCNDQLRRARALFGPSLFEALRSEDVDTLEELLLGPQAPRLSGKAPLGLLQIACLCHSPALAARALREPPSAAGFALAQALLEASSDSSSFWLADREDQAGLISQMISSEIERQELLGAAPGAKSARSRGVRTAL